MFIEDARKLLEANINTTDSELAVACKEQDDINLKVDTLRHELALLTAAMKELCPERVNAPVPSKTHIPVYKETSFA